MIVQRLTFQVEAGRLEELIALNRAASQWTGFAEKSSGRWRALTSGFGPMNQFVLELEFEDHAQLEAFWDDYFANPRTPEHQGKWDVCTTREASNEIWHLVDGG